ncbi:MAG: hypothetical protein Kow0069_35850 [Promethearchaeota archaeon]
MNDGKVRYAADARRLGAFLLVLAVVAGPLALWWRGDRAAWDAYPDRKGPYLSWERSPATSMTISWETPVPGDSVVEYGPSADLSGATMVADPENVSLHSVRLESLTPGARYYYRVRSSAPAGQEPFQSAVYSFKTAPGAFEPFTFAVLSDTQAKTIPATSRFDWVVEGIVANEGDRLAFALETGDKFEWGDDRPADARRWFAQVAPLAARVPVMSAVGNHDRRGGGELFFHYFFLPSEGNDTEAFYSFTYAECAFIVLDNSRYKPGYLSPDRLAWLENELREAAATARWTFVAFHVPPFASQFDFPYYQATLAPLLEKYNVTAAFSGHLHFYEHLRVNGVHYFVNGGGGGDLNGVHVVKPYSKSHELSRQHHYLRVRVESNRVVVTALSVANQTLDEVVIE